MGSEAGGGPLPVMDHPHLVLWREPDVAPLGGVMVHRVSVPASGLLVASGYLHELYYQGSLASVAALKEGFDADPRRVEATLPIIVVAFTPDGPVAQYPGVGDELQMVALEASVYLRELGTFEIQQSLIANAMKQAQERAVMEKILSGAPGLTRT